MSLQPTNGFLVLSDINGDGIDEVLIANKDSGGHPLERRLKCAHTAADGCAHHLEVPVSGEVAAGNAETGEFIILVDGEARPLTPCTTFASESTPPWSHDPGGLDPRLVLGT